MCCRNVSQKPLTVLFYPCQEKQEKVWKLIYKILHPQLKTHLCIFQLGLYIQDSKAWFIFVSADIDVPAIEASHRNQRLLWQSLITLKGAGDRFKEMIFISWSEYQGSSGLRSGMEQACSAHVENSLSFFFKILWCQSLLITALCQ